MDMQTKLIFVSQLGDDIRRFELNMDDILDKKSESSIYEIREDCGLKVCLESNNEKDYIEIDSCMNDEPSILRPGIWKVLAGYSQEYGILTPGCYGIKLNIDGMAYEFVYKVLPISMEWEGLLNLRSYLESVLKGLSQNLYMQHLTGERNIPIDTGFSIHGMYAYLKQSKRELYVAIDQITKNPITDIAREYGERSYSVHPDMKSQRWLSKKGMSLNSNSYYPNIVYEKHCISHKDITPNKWIKKMLVEIIYILGNMDKKYTEIVNRLNIVLKQEKAEIERLVKEIEMDKENWSLDPSVIYDKNVKLNGLNSDIENISKRVVALKEAQAEIQCIKVQLSYYVYETWLFQVNVADSLKKAPVSLFKDARYAKVYEIYSNISEADSKSSDRNIYFPSKKTQDLFEYYAVVLVVEVLRNMGFQWKSGWIADRLDTDLYNGELPKGTVMTFENEKYYCELAYDKVVEGNNRVYNQSKGAFMRYSARHYRPDIRVAFFDQSNRKMLGAFIVEAKCRKGKYMINQESSDPSSLQVQVLDYWGFGYCEDPRGNRPPIRDVIKKIIVIYPRQDCKVEYSRNDMNLSFVQVEATDDNDVKRHFGYMRLKEEIDEVINKYI